MSKKTNTLLFVLGATVFNVLITFISLAVLLFIYFKFFIPVLPESAAPWGFPIIFVGAIAASFFIYRTVLKQILKRVDMEKYCAPIFGPRRPAHHKPQD